MDYLGDTRGRTLGRKRDQRAAERDPGDIFCWIILGDLVLKNERPRCFKTVDPAVLKPVTGLIFVGFWVPAGSPRGSKITIFVENRHKIEKK